MGRKRSVRSSSSFFGYNKELESIEFGSELKSLHPMSENAKQFTPGTFRVYNTETCELINQESYHYFPKHYSDMKIIPIGVVTDIIRIIFEGSVRKRLESDRTVGCMLSGGLDSSIVSAIAAKYKTDIFTFSIGFDKSPDLLWARKVATFIGSNHNEIIVTPEEALESIDEVIYTIESYDVTTVRASVWNYLLAKNISQHTTVRVLLNGDGADEVMGGYKYHAYAPTPQDWMDENTKLLSNIHYFDGLRSDRCTASKWGLEPRSPFLDKEFVEAYFNIPYTIKTSVGRKLSKQVLRSAFRTFLPKSVIDRPKEAFSDGVSKEEDSWHKMTISHFDKLVTDKEFETRHSYKHNTPDTKEAFIIENNSNYTLEKNMRM